MRHASRGAIAFALAASSVRLAQAQEEKPGTLPRVEAANPADRPAYQVVYDHLTGALVVKNQKGQVVDSSRSLVRLPADRPALVVIENANALLYTYAASATVVTQKRVRLCGEVVSHYTQTSLVPTLGVVASGVAPGALGAKLLEASLPKSGGGSGGGERGKRSFSAAELHQTLELIRAPLTEYIVFATSVEQLAAGVQDSLIQFAELGESAPIDTLLARFQKSIERLATGLSDPTRVPGVLRTRADLVAAPRSELGAITGAIHSHDVTGGASSQDSAEAWRLERAVGDSAQGALRTAARRLQEGLRRVQVARARQQFALGPSGDVRRLVIRVEPSPDAEMKDIPRTRVGAVEVYTEPTVPVVCQLSAGVAWMHSPPKYAVQNGTVVDVADNTRVAGSLTFHLSAPAVPLVAALAGLGLGSSHRPDLYVGVSLRALDPVLVNGGVVWQYIAHLPPGVGLGQPASAAGFSQSLAYSYVGRLFWGLSYAP